MSKKAVMRSWYGVPREEITWHPTVDPELCMGCGICVINCGRGVFQFDYNRNVPVVARPLNCLVGCTTCQNTCPQHAISFPPLSYLHKLIKKYRVIQRSREELLANRERYEAKL
ncbi:MAG: 4Fe-4S ferredoxin [Thermoprotei archaeon]|nr:MAG: 4Fe-4S ferredoxin [Thermoprotei archaeon]